MSLIYVLEDDENIREIEIYALKNSGYQVKGYTTVKDFYKALEDMIPSLVILDIMLPDEDGIEVLKKLRSKSETKKVPVIMLTARTTEMDKVKGLENGADDYITKPFGVMEFVARVKAVLRRSEASYGMFLRLGAISVDNDKRVAYIKDKPCNLTYKEFELLKLFVCNAGIVLTRENIMNRIWETDYVGETRTVDMHVKTLRKKLGKFGDMIKTVRNVGYKIEEED
ncbi:MAG TPA: response regulator transcription factor [Acetivibrio sp.]|nr:response regulator transcription factor [Acetivibrio sp.]